MRSPRELLDQIAIDEGLPLDGFRLIVALVACSFVAPLLHAIKSETLRHAFNIVVGLSMGLLVFDYDVLHSIGAALAVYALLLVAPRRIVGKLVLALTFAYLVVGREYYSTHMLWNSAQMVLTLKLSSVAINYNDGALPKDKLTASMRENRLLTVPPLLPYLSYAFFFPTFLAGPIFEYSDFIAWMKDVRVAPLAVHTRNFVVVGISAAGFLLSMEFPDSVIDSREFYPESPWAMRCLRMCFHVMFFRFQLYLAWSLAEAASALAGIGYVKKTDKWNGITNTDILCVELPTNIRVGINNWNVGVARWMKTYIYERVGLSQSNKPGFLSTMSAVFVSALWHGVSPGYYLFFALYGFYIEAGKVLRRRVRPYFHYSEDRSMAPHAIFFSSTKGQSHPLAVVYDAGGVVITWIAMQSWYFLPHVIAISIILFSKLFPERPTTRPKGGIAVSQHAQSTEHAKIA